MSAVETLAFTISKEAMKLIKAGEAVLQSGGVRLLNGQMLEMANPVVSSAAKIANSFTLGPQGAIVQLASSLTGNVQSAFIQRSVNLANAKLDTVISQLTSLANAMQGLQQIQVLSWVTSAFSLANCGISVVGFHMTLDRLDQVNGRLREFYERYSRDQQNERVETFRNHLSTLKNYLFYLGERYQNNTFDQNSFLRREVDIEKELTHTGNFLRKTLKEFQSKDIDGQIGCQIIFTLATVYAQTMNEYCCQYYYAHGIRHPLYEDWMEVLNQIDSLAFREHLKRYFLFDGEYISVSPKTKQVAHSIAFEAVRQQKERLALCAEMVRQLPESEYIRLDDRLNEQVFSGLTLEIPELRNVNVDQLLMERIERDDCQFTEDDLVMIPLEIG